MTSSHDTGVMIAGIGGASLGTEILKCLALGARYRVFGCDVSATAYGLYAPGFERTFKLSRENYVASVVDACLQAGVQWVIPGGEQPMVLLGDAVTQLAEAGITLLGNDAQLVRTLSDKATTFVRLSELGFEIPRTVELRHMEDIAHVGTPCVVKPATGSGGSAMVFFVTTAEEAMTYAEFIRRSGHMPIAQEYIGVEEGEYTVGVLSLPTGEVVGSTALRRTLDAKLSLAFRGRGGVISSGYSQGYIGPFPSLREQAEAIARSVGSRGPINIQGRVRDGKLIPFEINPRFSASTYLRALAGFNEVEMLLRFLAFGERPVVGRIREGWYLRSLTETYIRPEELRA
jgi:carbamoyl-phosphate synthase large subunit